MKTKNDMETNRSHIGRKVRKREIDSSLAKGAETLMLDAQSDNRTWGSPCVLD